MYLRSFGIIFLCAFLSTEIFADQILSLEEEWTKWKGTYGAQLRTIDEDQINEYKSNFEKTHNQILENNKLYETGEATFEMEHNQFSAMSNEEFSEFLQGQNDFTAVPAVKRYSTITSVPKGWKPTTVNNVVKEIPVKNQRKGPFCSAFCGVGLVEFYLWKKYNHYFDLSEQHITDCATNGRTRYVYDYILENGIYFEDNYPYVMQKGECRATSEIQNDGSGIAKDFFPEEYFTLPRDETVLAYALELYGWISVPVNGTPFKSYKTGVITRAQCGNLINHAVIIVGLGIDSETGLKYWLIRNSWGEKWGYNGYLKIERGKNACDICNAFGDRIYFDWKNEDTLRDDIPNNPIVKQKQLS